MAGRSRVRRRRGGWGKGFEKPQPRWGNGFEKVPTKWSIGFENLQVLGPPLATREVENRDKTTVTVWYYSEPLAKSFKHRALIFDRSQRLIEKVSYEWQD